MWSYVPVETDPALVRRVLAGEVDVVAWAPPHELRSFIRRSPLRFVGIVNSAPDKWGQAVAGLIVRPVEALDEWDPRRTAVMCFFHRGPSFVNVLAELARRNLPCLLPLPFPTIPMAVRRQW
jgi:hypothetical protein